MDANSNKTAEQGPESRKQLGNNPSVGNLPGPGDSGKQPVDNLPDRRADAGSATVARAIQKTTESTQAIDRDPSLAAILGQIAALNWEISGNVRVTREQEAILRQAVDPDWVEIKYPDIPYLPVAYYRKVLNDAFGPMGWSLVEVGKAQKVNECYYLPCVLICQGQPVAKAVGECELKGGNTKLTDGDAVEACRSNAITRCCKTLGIAEELHWPAWLRKFKREHCREVGRDKWGNMVIARKDDEAGAKLFAKRIDNEDMSRTGGDPYIAQFEAHAAAIRQEPDTQTDHDADVWEEGE